MARNFVAANSDYLYHGILPLTAYPVTLACWFKSASETATKSLICFGHNSLARNVYIGLVTTKETFALVNDSGGTSYSISTTKYNAGQWNHAAGVFAGNTSRSSYMNGGGKGTNTVSRVFTSSMSRTHIGAKLYAGTVTNYMDGAIAEVGIWNAALTDDEVAALAAGFSPLFVRPAKLVWYLPLLKVRGLYNPELMNADEFFDYGSPSMADHPHIIYPARPQVIVPAPGNNIPVIMQHYKKMRVA